VRSGSLPPRQHGTSWQHRLRDCWQRARKNKAIKGPKAKDPGEPEQKMSTQDPCQTASQTGVPNMEPPRAWAALHCPVATSPKCLSAVGLVGLRLGPYQSTRSYSCRGGKSECGKSSKCYTDFRGGTVSIRAPVGCKPNCSNLIRQVYLQCHMQYTV
jgi:hypothetical protein